MYMSNNGIHLLLLQETHGRTSHKETREDTCWYFSTSTKKLESHEAKYRGVAVVINKKLDKQIAKVIPHSDRLMSMELRLTPPLTVISAHAPHAFRPEEEKEEFYAELNALE